MLRQYDSIIFDLDGTLSNLTETGVVSWNGGLGPFDESDQPVIAEALQSVFGMKVDSPSLSKE